uniref:CHK kinase-like domain-containing protein n=1 Tax=Panagrolaimus sp. ES5 TaxID=591445 RepID=A0AC34F9S6_9BILA
MKSERLENDFLLSSNSVFTISRYAQLSIEILLARNLEFFTEEVAEKLRDLAHPEMLEQILVRCDDLFPVLVHSAIWPGNVLWSSEDNSQLLSIIDWQGCFSGSPTADLAALLAISVGAEERQKNEDEYLKYYIQKFDEFREKEKIDTVLDFGTVKESYGRSLLYSMIELIVVIISNPLDDVIEEGEIYGVMTKRLKALIEDLLLD